LYNVRIEFQQFIFYKYYFINTHIETIYMYGNKTETYVDNSTNCMQIHIRRTSIITVSVVIPAIPYNILYLHVDKKGKYRCFYTVKV